MSKSEFTPSRDGIDFFMETGRKYTEDSMSKGKIPSPIDHFKFMCDQLHTHPNPEIRVGFAQSLMYLGFKAFMDIVAKSMMQTLSLGDKAQGILKELSAEKLQNMSPEEASELLDSLRLEG